MEVQEETLIDDQTQQVYRVWKKNAPFLYDYILTNSLLWPSLTIQFFPDLTTGDDVVFQRVLHGTFTLGQSTDSISILQLPLYKNLNHDIQINKLDYNHEKQEFELQTASLHKPRVLQQINHYGDVNKVRYMPQKPNVLASSNNVGDLVVYERTKHANFKNSITNDLNRPQLRLTGKTKEQGVDIFALDWNLQKEGVLVAANMVGDINVFDIKGHYDKQETMQQTQYLDNGNVGVNDIEWFPNHDSVLASVDDSGTIKVYDTRTNAVVRQHTPAAVAINSVSISPLQTSVLATGDSDGLISIWDLRTFGLENTTPIKQLNHHTDSITQLKWHPKLSNVLGSSSSDKLVRLYDVGLEDELVFVHAGHMLGVNDFDWSQHDDWLVASVADDNSLHVWKPAHRS